MFAFGTATLVPGSGLKDDQIVDVNKILQQLREERSQLEEAIMAIERLAMYRQGRRRGRPPKWLAEQKAEAQKPAKRRGRPPSKRTAALTESGG
jgi:hypothetical protein